MAIIILGLCLSLVAIFIYYSASGTSEKSENRSALCALNSGGFLRSILPFIVTIAVAEFIGLSFFSYYGFKIWTEIHFIVLLSIVIGDLIIWNPVAIIGAFIQPFTSVFTDVAVQPWEFISSWIIIISIVAIIFNIYYEKRYGLRVAPYITYLLLLIVIVTCHYSTYKSWTEFSP